MFYFASFFFEFVETNDSKIIIIFCFNTPIHYIIKPIERRTNELNAAKATIRTK